MVAPDRDGQVELACVVQHDGALAVLRDRFCVIENAVVCALQSGFHLRGQQFLAAGAG